jgi:hypothetical protein
MSGRTVPARLCRDLVQSGAITPEEFQRMVPSQQTQDRSAASSERLGAARPS